MSSNNEYLFEYLLQAMPVLREVQTDCPACGDVGQPLYYMIMHLNDDHECTREQIADFVDEVSEKYGVEFELRPPCDK